MDTDDLSDRSYRAILIEAERFNHDLTLHFGLLSERCDDEQDFFDKSLQLIDALQSAEADELDDVFFGQSPDPVKLHKTLDKIRRNCVKLNHNR